MAYADRLRGAAYTSPSGTRFELQFDDLERSGGKKASVHEFPQRDDVEVQDLGNAAERYPMSAYFTGDDYDQRADAFKAALGESGPGTLHHPRWGDIPVFIMGWTQSEKFVDGLGRADFKLDFIKVKPATEIEVFPVTEVAQADAITAITDESIASVTAEAAEAFAPINAADVTACQEIESTVNAAAVENLEAIVAQDPKKATTFRDISRGIENGIDSIAASPLKVFQDVAAIMKLPAQLITKITGKIEAYRSLIVATLESIPRSYAQALAQAQALYCALGGVLSATTVGTLASRSEAIAAAEAAEELAATVAEAIEGYEATVEGYRADPEIASAMAEAAAVAKASLIERAYSLRAERRVVLATDRTPLDFIASVTADLSAGLEGPLDEFIEANGLHGAELLLIPAGREVVYYA